MNIREIAKLAGVSVSTVSKIINQKDNGISRETRERVLRIAREYHYVPYASTVNPTAKTWLIGILIRNDVSSSTLISGMIATMQTSGYTAIVCENRVDLTQELKNITALCRSRVDGVLWEPVGPESMAYAAQLQELGIPYVTLNGSQEDSSSIDYERLGYQATGAMLSYRHTGIACLLSEGKRTQKFLAGYKRCLFDHQIPLVEEFIFHEVSASLLHKISTHTVTAIVSSHFSAALTLYETLDSHHYRIPYDISLITLKDDARNEVHFPHISTYTIPHFSFGVHLCTKLLACIEKRTEFHDEFHPAITLQNTSTVGVPYQMNAKRLVVVGSINIDTYLNVERLPRSGKTVSTSNSAVFPGGKGVNQAIGASRLGHTVSLIGNVGSDLDSDLIYEALREHGIHPMGVKRCANARTGKAYITVAKDGESMISILSGANGLFSPEDLLEKERLFENAGYCLIQTEIPLDAVSKACTIAKAQGGMTILKPSACGALPESLLRKVDYLVPNEDELHELCPQAAGLEAKAQCLIEKGVGTVLVTLGQKGCFVTTGDWFQYFPVADFPSIDSTGASDAFISAFASYLLYGYSLSSAIQIATYAAGFSISREGVAPALIDKSSLEAYIRQVEPELLQKS